MQKDDSKKDAIEWKVGSEKKQKQQQQRRGKKKKKEVSLFVLTRKHENS